jgi:hypothetical protein
VSDGSSLLLSLGRGRWFDALISGVSLVPYVGDLAKLGKLPRYLETVKTAIALSARSAEANRLLAPILFRLHRIVELMPRQLPAPLAALRTELEGFANANRVGATIAKVLPDIRNQFRFTPRWREGAFEFESISGRLGIPGKVRTFNPASERRAISAGTGEHAGHRIGARFGAPTDATNLSLQNANINTHAPKALQEAFQGSGGNYLRMENEWEQLLHEGYGIEVKVTDKYRAGESRPISRLVEWVEISPSGARTERHLDYGNFGSPQARAANR